MDANEGHGLGCLIDVVLLPVRGRWKRNVDDPARGESWMAVESFGRRQRERSDGVYVLAQDWARRRYHLVWDLAVEMVRRVGGGETCWGSEKRRK